MKTKHLLAILCLMPTAVSSQTHAELITFDFGNSAGISLNGLSTGLVSASSGGITLTLDATAIGGVFRRDVSGGFGIDASGGIDDADAFDGGQTNEIMEFSITSDVLLSDLTLVSFDFDRFEASDDDAASVTRNGNLLGGFLGPFFDSDLDSNDVLVLAESGILDTDTFELAHLGLDGSGTVRGFGLERITFSATTAGAAVPEPGAAILVAGGLFGLWLRRRQHR